MQEEVEGKTFNLCIATSKLTTATLLKIGSFLYQKGKARLHQPKVGKMSVKQLLAQNKGATSIDIGETTIKDFERILKKYGVDFALKQDKTVDPPKYLLFFKAQDQDVLSQAFKEYTKKVMEHEQRDSIKDQLAHYIEVARSIPAKVIHKNREASL